MPSKDKFLSAIEADSSLPADLRDIATKVANLEERKIDSSYIQFLDEQISLSPRGPKWTDILKRRREALAPYCDRVTLSGTVADYTVRVDPEKQTVIHWELQDTEAEV
jgi:hypothetical protein